MAAGCIPDALPWDIPLIAHQAGFQSSGMWVDPNTTWDKNALNKTRDSLKKTEIQLIDIEVTWLEHDDILSDNHKLIIDVDSQIKVNFSNGDYVKFLEPLTDGPISPHDKLETLFNYYRLQGPIHEACKKSLKHLQLFLVNEEQRTYLSQGVQIADKHIEIIVKQMTSKIRVLNGGETTLLPGEILDINQAKLITAAALTAGEEPPVYKPVSYTHLTLPTKRIV